MRNSNLFKIRIKQKEIGEEPCHKSREILWGSFPPGKLFWQLSCRKQKSPGVSSYDDTEGKEPMTDDIAFNN